MQNYLEPRQIDEFYEIGYVVVHDVFGQRELKRIDQALDRLQAMARPLNGMVMHRGSQFVVDQIKIGNDTRAQIKRVVWCGDAEPELLELGQDPRLTKMAAQILGTSRMNHLINQVHFKLPHDGVFFPFHQDSRHRGYGTPDWHDINGRGSYVQMVMAIDEVTLDNGPMLFIPRSCRNGHLGLPYDEREETVSDFFNPDDAVAVPMEPGTVALFGPYTIHGSLPNNSNSRRRVFINGFAAEGANSRKYPGDGSGELLDVTDR